MADVSNEVNRHQYNHNHRNVQETAKLHYTNCVNCFFFNIDFQRSKDGFMFCEKNLNSKFVILSLIKEKYGR